ncbi:MAG: lipoprotein [Rhodospirillaceae bacterium BRH_c57]|nr:MAG: lipoprotein [Rhodospirillaceae bacterium BRH_c57]
MRLFAVAFALVTLAIPASAADVQVASTEVGEVLADGQGMTLYTFDKDAPGTSNCTGTCAENWPPMPAEGEISGEYSVVERPDGIEQLAYQGQPLYRWIKDKEPGQVTGDGVNGVWHAAKP